MTRFARAKGSKASNERREEDPTPWHVMRQQLVNQLNNTEVPGSENSTYNLKSLLNDKHDVKEEVWSEFGEVKGKKNNPVISEVHKKPQRNTEKKRKKKISQNNNESDTMTHDPIEDRQLKTNKKRKKTLKSLRNEESNGGLNCEKESNDDSDLVKKKKIKKNNKNQEVRYNKKSKKQNNLLLIKNNLPDHESTIHSRCNEVNDTDSSKQILEITDALTSKKGLKKQNKEVPLNGYNTGKKTKQYFQSRNNSNNHTIIANGREIEVVDFEGFLIKKDDASELRKLRNKLRKKNVPNEKIKAVIKLERRRAEKALAREKTNVCFHCRNFGHKFSDCPDIKDTELSRSGICFKCGSTEHSHYECKVLQNQEFRYAVCFICKEQGHIARQCPLNSQGQYPKGGSCHVCGEVTHLRKDCPKAAENQSSNSKVITVEKLKDNNLEDICVQPLNNKESNMKKSRLVKF